MRRALFIGRKEVLYQLRSRETLLWVFILPIVFFFFIGSVTGGMSRRGGAVQRIVLEAPADAGWLADRLQRNLEAQEFAVERVGPGEAGASGASRRLVLPVGVMDSLAVGRQATVRFVHGGEGIAGDYDVMRAGRATYTLVADLVAAGGMLARARGDTAAAADTVRANAAALAALDSLPRTIALEVAAAGKRKTIPIGMQQAVPGTLVMFVLLVMGTSGAVMLVQERKQGLLRRLAATPIARREVVLGKWGGKMALGLVQVAFAMVVGSVLFNVDWGPDLAMVLAVLVAYAALAAGIGLLLGTLARTEGQAVAIGVIAANGLGALGGCWWPIEVAPRWMQGLQLFIPTGWAMDALHRLMSYQAGPGSAVVHVAGMAVGAAVLVAAASRLFRYE